MSSANNFLESCGFPCPAQYNPADHWVETLAVVPGQEEHCRNRLAKITDQFERSEEGREIKEMAVADSRNTESLASSKVRLIIISFTIECLVTRSNYKYIFIELE